jgi:hypothetical protein
MLKRTLLLTVATATLLAPAALAGHDERLGPANRLVVLADDLAIAADDMRREIVHRQRGRGRGRGHQSSELLVALTRLERQADRFRYAAARNASPRRLDVNFDGLLRTFNQAERSMNHVRSGRLQREFLQVEKAMRRLSRRVDVARGPQLRRRDDRLHGTIVLGDSRRNSRFQVRIGF